MQCTDRYGQLKLPQNLKPNLKFGSVRSGNYEHIKAARASTNREIAAIFINKSESIANCPTESCLSGLQ